MKKKLITDPIYESYFWLVWDCNINELHNWIVKEYNYEIQSSNETEHLGKFVKITGEDYVANIIWVNDKKNIPTLSHELLHFTFATMKERGISLDGNSEEAFTYLFTWYMKTVLKALNPPRKPITNT